MNDPNEDVNFEIDESYYTTYSYLDERLKKLGPLISNSTSIGIIHVLLKNGELTASGIRELSVNESKPSLAGLSYHLDRMVEIDLLQVTEKRQRKKGPVLKHYKMNGIGILLVPSEYIEKVNKNKTLKSAFKTVFKDGIKIASIIIVSFISSRIFSTDKQLQGDVADPIIPFANIPFVIIIIGLIILLIEKRKKWG